MPRTALSTVPEANPVVQVDRDYSSYTVAEPIDREKTNHQFVNDYALYDNTRSPIPGQLRTDWRSGYSADPHPVAPDLPEMILGWLGRFLRR
jgi:hypothetical protein